MLDWQLCQICYPLEIKLLLHNMDIALFAYIDDLDQHGHSYAIYDQGH